MAKVGLRCFAVICLGVFASNLWPSDKSIENSSPRTANGFLLVETYSYTVFRCRILQMHHIRGKLHTWLRSSSEGDRLSKFVNKQSSANRRLCKFLGSQAQKASRRSRKLPPVMRRMPVFSAHSWHTNVDFWCAGVTATTCSEGCQAWVVALLGTKDMNTVTLL